MGWYTFRDSSLDTLIKESGALPAELKVHVLSLIALIFLSAHSCSHYVRNRGLSAAPQLLAIQRLPALVPAELKVHVFKSNLQNRTM